MKKLLQLLKKYEEVISYLLFGGLTTLVNYIVYLPCYNILHLSGALSNAIAWAFAVAGIGSPVAHSKLTLIFLTVIAVLAIVRHHSNIRRLLNGTESRFGKDKKA